MCKNQQLQDRHRTFDFVMPTGQERRIMLVQSVFNVQNAADTNDILKKKALSSFLILRFGSTITIRILNYIYAHLIKRFLQFL